MCDTLHQNLTTWTVDYNDERVPHEVEIPHTWAQEVPLAYEGPVIYRRSVAVPAHPSKLVFYGVSYQAQVFLNGALAAVHRGIWDAFEVPLGGFSGQTIEVTVRVIKNGGETFPVKDVASGFLPFVFHTFGGMHGEVELVPMTDPSPGDEPAPPTRVRVDGHRITVDGKPFYPRGLLHWGWYPQVGHTHAPADVIRREVREAKRLGFNLVKFCLWVPPHRYFDILREEGMEAWLELPLWDPSGDTARLEAMARELEQIVREYRRHDNILIWTVGCELHVTTPASYREYLVRYVQAQTGCPLVKDNSGGAEMYGGDLREYGDFYDFHPYCDTPFFPAVMDSLLPGPRQTMPILLGETNDTDVHRDLARMGNELPYWISSLPELNDQGVRWQHDMPKIVAENRFALFPEENGHAALMESSRRKAMFIRKTVHEAFRARDQVSGYVLTGWRDTPISASGFFDDWDRARFERNEIAEWHGPDVLFLIPTRRPPFRDGGNRPGFLDSHAFFPGQLFWRVGIHSEAGLNGGLVWQVLASDGGVVARGAGASQTIDPLTGTEVAEVHCVCETPGEYWLHVEFAGVTNQWPVWVVPAWDTTMVEGWTLEDPREVFDGLGWPGGPNVVATGDAHGVDGDAVLFLPDRHTLAKPFWREAAYEFLNQEFWSAVPFAERWERLHAVSPDRVIEPEWLAGLGEVEVLMNRIDVRTYAEHPVLARVRRPNDRTWIVTTLRPHGGLGVQPPSLKANPAGQALLASLIRQAGVPSKT